MTPYVSELELGQPMHFTPETTSPEIISDTEVQERFNAMVAELDAGYTPADERLLDKTITAKINGKEEEFNMWGPYVIPPPPAG